MEKIYCKILNGRFVSNDSLALDLDYLQSLGIGFSILCVINTFNIVLFGDAILTDFNVILLMLLSAGLIYRFSRLYSHCREFFRILNQDAFNSGDVLNHKNLMGKVAQMYVESLEPYTFDSTHTSDSKNSPSCSLVP